MEWREIPIVVNDIQLFLSSMKSFLIQLGNTRIFIGMIRAEKQISIHASLTEQNRRFQTHNKGYLASRFDPFI